jgi:hypothetical protein
MHVPGVKQEQPDVKAPIRGPLFIDFTVRDGDNTKILKAAGKQPKDVVKILNSILRKMDKKGTFEAHEMQNAQERPDTLEEIADLAEDPIDTAMFDGEPLPEGIS